MDLASHHHYRAVAVTARRLMAEIYQRSDEIELAEAYYRQSLDLALGPGLRPEQAHCQYGLAQVWIWSGRNDEAREVVKAADELYAEPEMPPASSNFP
jgi:hypothetical protein